MVVSSLVRRSLIRAAIPKLFAAGFSANRAQKYMDTLLGGTYRRMLYLADWREITGARKLQESFRFIPKKYRLSFGLTTPRAGKMSTNYQYLFRVSGMDAEGERMENQWVSMLDDVRMSPEEAQEIMQRTISDPEYPGGPQEGMTAYKLELFVVYRNRDIVFRR